MPLKRINGIHLEQMLRNGLANLQNSESELNRLNVFPVPDGDTGTNMMITLQYGLRNADSNADAGLFLKSLSEGMLLGARGNSGAILSQFFRGFYLELSRYTFLGPGELRAGLVRGYRVAYQSVIQPVEGTILSVAREGIEHIRRQITRNTTIDSLLAMYVAEMKKTLSYTPEMLSVLKESGVVDSGAYGFIIIFEGMLKCLRGETIDAGEELVNVSEPAAAKAIDFSLFNEKSAFTDGYCMEYILQLLLDPAYNQDFDTEVYIEAIKKYGNSIVCVRDGKRVKVHIHTKTPANIIHLSQKFGEFLTFKLENMQLQHNERDVLVSADPPKPVAIIAGADGEGMKKLFTDFGCDSVIDFADKDGVTARGIAAMIKGANAGSVVVLPNDKAILEAALEAASLLPDTKVTVLPTESCAEGYFALAMDIPDSDDAELRISQMRTGIDGVDTLCETTASGDYTFHEVTCKKGEHIVLNKGEIICVSSDWKKAVTEAFRLVDPDNERETCIVFRGSGVPEEAEGELADALSELCPLLDVEIIDGGQSSYDWIIGIV